MGWLSIRLRHPRDVPSVDPSTLGQKTLYILASLVHCTYLRGRSGITIPGSPLCLCMCLAHFLSVLNDFSQGAHL